MDCMKTGVLIKKLRLEKNLTQKDIADALLISNKTVSKWECGLGCPDISLLAKLSEILDADMAGLLEGEMSVKSPDNGNLNRIKFYVCDKCNNIITTTSTTSVFCCGRKLNELKVRDKLLEIKIERIDDEYFVTIDHAMTKEDYILFVAIVKNDTVILKRLYPEQNPEISFPLYYGAKLYVCNNHYELFCSKLQTK